MIAQTMPYQTAGFGAPAGGMFGTAGGMGNTMFPTQQAMGNLGGYGSFSGTPGMGTPGNTGIVPPANSASFGGGSSLGAGMPGQTMPNPSGNVPLSQRPIGTLYGQPLYPNGQTGQMGGSSPYSAPSTGGMGGFSSYSQSASQNPYLKQQIQGLQGQFNQNLTRNLLPAIQSSASAVGGIGGARQGIAQGLAMGDSQTGFANAAMNLMGQDYENSQNRALQAYGMDQSNALGYLNSDRNYGLGMGGLQNQRYGMDQNYNLGQGQLGLGWFNGQNQYNLGSQQNANQANQIANQYQLGQGQLGLAGQGQMLDFYNTQGSQDIQRYLAGLQGIQTGANLPWQPLQQFGNMINPYTGNGTTTDTTNQGGGAMGAFGGALGTWQLMNLLNQGH